MTGAAPADQPAQLRSVVRTYALGSLLLVGLVAGAFTLVGAVADAPDAESAVGEDPASADPDVPDADAAPTPSEPPEGEADPAPTEDPDPDVTDPADRGEDPDPVSEPEPESDPDPEPDPASEPEPESDPDPEPDPEPDQGDRFEPADIGVQVLDGYQADGGAAAAAVASTLGDLGYRIVATNPALRYEVTTVLWTTGFEAEARQVAADLGGAEVREQPGNLSDAVAVHVVVGADRG